MCDQLMRPIGVSVIGDVKSPQAAATLLAWHQAIKIGMGGDDARLLEILDKILIDEPVFLAPDVPQGTP